MPQKKDSGKGKGKSKAESDASDGRAGKLKAAQSINVRHILVSAGLGWQCLLSDTLVVRKAFQEGRGAGQITRWCEI